MSKKLAAKSGLIQLPPLVDAQFEAPSGHVGISSADSDSFTAHPPSPAPKVKTAPGAMLHFMTRQSSAVSEADTLRARFHDALPARKLDPAAIAVSRWANRHAKSFEHADFDELKAEISGAGGNVQPIKVRPIGGEESGRYELVFGHRRHRACLALGLPVLAIVENLSDQQLFVEMDRENRGRKNLSPWEQGQMYARALDEGLYTSNRQLASAIGKDVSDLGKALVIARLPASVIEAFSSPLDLQFRWAKTLNDALQKDPDGLLERARRLREEKATLTPAEVFARLAPAQQSELAGRPSKSFPVMVGGRSVGKVMVEPSGQINLTLKSSTLPLARLDELATAVAAFLER